MRSDRKRTALAELQSSMPRAWEQLLAIKRRLERRLGDAQDIEFTIERGKVWVVQMRTAKRTAAAAVRMAGEMAGQRIIDRRTALRRVEPAQVEQLLHPSLDAHLAPLPLTSGLPASPGAACGRIAFSAAERGGAENGGKIILVRSETDADDVAGMAGCEGVLTSSGGMTSHAAVVARGMGKPCVVGAADLQIDTSRRRMSIGSHRLNDGDWLSIDGSTGQVYEGQVPIKRGQIGSDLRKLLGWADRYRRLGVRANADTPQDARLRASWAPKASACAGPSTCSSARRSGWRPCAR